MKQIRKFIYRRKIRRICIPPRLYPDALMEQAEIRKAEISQRILRLKSEEEEQQTILTTARKQYDEITSQIENANEECEHLNLSVMKIQEKLKEQNTKLEAEQTAYHREASRLDSLRNIAERYDGYGNSIRRVMEQKERVPGIQGVVADLIQVNKDYEIAIETALGGSIQNIVTDNEHACFGRAFHDRISEKESLWTCDLSSHEQHKSQR